MNAPRQADDMPLVPTRLALLSIAGFWAFYFVINTLRIAFADQPDQFGMAWRRAVVTLLGMAITAILWQLLARRAHWPSGRLVALVFAASAPISFAYSLVNHLVFFVIAPSPSILEEMASWRERPESIWHYIAALAASWYFFVVAWGILYIALAYAGRLQRAERQAAIFKAEAQTAQLRALRYQVNPHFLFNTLNSLSAQVMAGRAEAAEAMILNLSTFFRSSLATDPEADVPLADEIALQRLYLDIEQVRFPQRLRVDIDMPPQLGTARVPALILQPLVENAIRHGVAMSSAPVTISITARAEGDMLLITIADDAAPLGVAPKGNGIGVRNVCARLEARHGSRARCTPGPRPCGGYAVQLEIPLETAHV